MLTDVEFDKDVFVNSLVKTAQEFHGKDIKPVSISIPQKTFKHFRDSLTYEHMFSDHTQWQKEIWNSAHNPIYFKRPMFMGLVIEVVPDKNVQNNICYMLPSPEFGDIKIPFEYSLRLIRKHKIKTNLVSILVKSRAVDYRNIPKSEWCAIEALREMITETEFRKYMKYGFILVQGKSGDTYQLFRQRRHIKVWNKGKIIEEICVRIRDKKIPLTDSVIAFKIMLETSEEEFKKLGNVYNMRRAA